jgi:hypothetical protein
MPRAREEGTPVLAIDPLGPPAPAGDSLHRRRATRKLVGDPNTPLRNLIIGITDPSGSEIRNPK